MSESHWDGVYTSKSASDVSWYESPPMTSVRLVTSAVAVGSVIDVGAGASMLADELVERDYAVTVLDISSAALEVVRERLDARVKYVVGDVLEWQPDAVYDVWHDRAVFHFLTDPASQRAYVELAKRAVRPGGALVLGTFAPDGPETCSGLPTARYSPDDLEAMFADGFALESGERETHHTPWGSVQQFTRATLRRAPTGSTRSVTGEVAG